jgi:hypothetical protein
MTRRVTNAPDHAVIIGGLLIFGGAIGFLITGMVDAITIPKYAIAGRDAKSGEATGPQIHLAGAPGQKMFSFILTGPKSLEGRWAAPSGLTLSLRNQDGSYRHEWVLATASEPDWRTIHWYRGGSSVKDLSILVQNFAIPTRPFPQKETLLGRIEGDLAWPEFGEMGTFVVKSTAVSVPVELEIRPEASRFARIQQVEIGFGLAIVLGGVVFVFGLWAVKRRDRVKAP